MLCHDHALHIFKFLQDPQQFAIKLLRPFTHANSWRHLFVVCIYPHDISIFMSESLKSEFVLPLLSISSINIILFHVSGRYWSTLARDVPFAGLMVYTWPIVLVYSRSMKNHFSDDLTPEKEP